MTTLAELQKQWYAEDTGASSETNPLTSLIPQIGSLFSPTKVKSSSSQSVSGAGGFFIGNPQSILSAKNDDKELAIIARIVVFGLAIVVILKAAK